MNAYMMAAAAMVITKVSYDLLNDIRIRDRVYTQPLKTMPANAKQLIDEMMAEAAKDKSLSTDQLAQIEKGIYKMLSEGAVEQRNFEMKKTREMISYVGLFLSWFMKQKGLSYEQIQAKYIKEFSVSEREGHLKIIESAAGSNSDLMGKFYYTLRKKFGFGASVSNSHLKQAKL
ncbi:MAG: hypothetical protein ACOY7J_00905 [Pseudomonadota bacterium]